MTFVRNIWYVAGHAEEAGETPFSRIYLNEPVVIYRTDGGLVAMDDRCPHRLAPLHKGKVIDGAIQCPYHGLRFDGTGTCVHMPLGGEAPPRAKLKTYPIVERYSLLWIWMGDPALADPATIPDYSDREDPDTAWFTGVLHCNANYQLLVDNLLDLSHSEFLHPFLSSEGWAGRNRQTVTQEGNRITIVNTAEEDNILPVMQQFRPDMGKIGTTIQTEYWDAPSLIRLSVDYYSGDESIIIPSAHILTPETEKSTHYFVRGGQREAVDNPEVTAAMRAGVLAVFEHQDIPIIEAQQRYIGDGELMEHEPAVLRSDRAAVLARRHISKLIRQEVEQAQQAMQAVAAE